MKKYCLLLSLFLLSTLGYAQSKFGNATKEELEMKTYENDTTASAVVLKKDGYLKFLIDKRGRFQYEYTEEKKIKILKSEGLHYANHHVDYYFASRNSKEEIRSLSGTTYNLENGKVNRTKLSKENIFDEDIDGKLNRRKFTMPAAKVGSIIEYKYTIVSDFIYELKDFVFQENIPIQEVSFEALIPEYLTYFQHPQGYVSLDETKQEPTQTSFFVVLDGGTRSGVSGNIDCQATRYIYKASNVPSAKDDAFLWAISNYISKVSFELRSTNFPGDFVKPASSTWENIDKELLDSDSFGKNIKRADWFKNDISNGEVSLERATEILEMIKGRMQWNKEHRLTSSKMKKALEDGVGNSADMNMLLINALVAGGFDAYPVVLSTRGNGNIPITHPSIIALNYVIVGIQIDDKPIILMLRPNLAHGMSFLKNVWSLKPEHYSTIREDNGSI